MSEYEDAPWADDYAECTCGHYKESHPCDAACGCDREYTVARETSTDPTARLAALLGEHWTAGMAANGAARKWECVCGERIAMSDAAHRAHVAAVLAEASVARHVEAERERIAQAIESESDKASVRELSDPSAYARRVAYDRAANIARGGA